MDNIQHTTEWNNSMTYTILLVARIFKYKHKCYVNYTQILISMST